MIPEYTGQRADNLSINGHGHLVADAGNVLVSCGGSGRAHFPGPCNDLPFPSHVGEANHSQYEIRGETNTSDMDVEKHMLLRFYVPK